MSSPLPQERQLYADALRRLERGERVARATLVRAWGSVPREVGAKMLVFADGSIQGTVGGGCGEAEVWQAAMEVHTTGQAVRVEVDLTEDQSSDSGKVCGGRFEVFIDLWESPPAGLREALHQNTPALLVTYLGPEPARAWRRSSSPPASPQGDPGASQLLTTPDARFWERAFPAGHPLVWSDQGQEYFLDPLTQGLELIIAGAGHIARPLAAMAQRCGYLVSVVDDRCEYARPELFPEARVVCQPFAEFFQSLPIHAQSHIVLVTRGHKFDEICLRQLLGKPVGYLGMIGSLRRTRAVLDELRREGVDGAWLDAIRAPIGLDIGALTPEEISISILAEMILLRRGPKVPGHGGIPLSTPKRVRHPGESTPV